MLCRFIHTDKEQKQVIMQNMLYHCLEWKLGVIPDPETNTVLLV